MEVVQPYFDSALSFLNNGYSQVNGPQGLLIALLAVVLMSSWGQLLPITLGATFAYAVVEAIKPIVMDGGNIELPPVTDPDYLMTLGSLYVGLLIIIAMFFAVKKVLFMRSGGAKARAH
jgi:hypothetical protein